MSAFKKNTAVTGFLVHLVSASDGSDITTGTPVGYYTLDGGTQTAIGDVTPVHEGNGVWSFDLLAAEMNGDVVGLTFTHASAITQHFTIKPDTVLVSELNDAAAITDIINHRVTIPFRCDLANTKGYRFGIQVWNMLDDLPTTTEITPGTISIDRCAIGGTTWSAVITDQACSEVDGLIYYDEVVNASAGYAEGDNLRITFKSQSLSIGGNTVNLTPASGLRDYTYVVDSIPVTTPEAIADQVWDEAQADHVAVGSMGILGSEIASILNLAGTAGVVVATNNDKTGYALQEDFRIKKNTALPAFMFTMIDSSDHASPITGRTITAERSIDGAAFAACANSAAEISDGWYQINLAAADLNGDVIALRFAASGADDRGFTIVTQTE